MLRIHLTAEDLLKTRFASQPAPLVETGLAIAALKRREPLFGAWRRSAAARFPEAARPLLELIPPSATGPLFLDPVSADLAEGLELVQSAPDSLVTGELRRVAGSRPPGPWLRSLAARDRDTWRDLDRALRAAHRHLVEAAWPRILSAFRSDLAWRARMIGEFGAQAAISSLHPGIGWNGTVLQIETPKELDFHPGGAGLTLMPTAMWTGRAIVAGDLDGPVTIVYPAVTPLPLVDQVTRDPLAGLLGYTRAAVLRLALTERTTTELASELGVSAATVSGHTKALRAAGLIATARAGKAVLHSVTHSAASYSTARRASGLAGPRAAAVTGRSAELADPPDGLVDRIAAGDLDVVDDGAVPEPDHPITAGRDTEAPARSRCPGR